MALGDRRLEAICAGDDLPVDTLKEVLTMFGDYRKDKLAASYFTKVALSKFAGYFVADADALRAVRRKRSKKTMMQGIEEFFKDREPTAQVTPVRGTPEARRRRSAKRAEASRREKEKEKEGVVGAEAGATVHTGVQEGASREAIHEGVQEQELLAMSTPVTAAELTAVEGLLKTIRERAGTPADRTSARVVNPMTSFSGMGGRAMNLDLVSSSEDEDDDSVRELDRGAAAFFAACPLRVYKTGGWTRSMAILVSNCAAVKKVVQTWDLVLMNKAKPMLPDHLRACSARVPARDVLEDEGPIRLTKRYILALRRFVNKHINGASSPKVPKLAVRRERASRQKLFELEGEESASSSEDEIRDVRKKLAVLRARLLPQAADPVDAYMLGEVKRVKQADAIYKRRHPE